MSDPAGFRAPPERPWTVTAAAWITISCCAITLLVLCVGFLATTLGRSSLADDGERELLNGLAVVCAVGSVWCVVTIGLAVAAMRRSRAAWIMALVSSGLSVVATGVTGVLIFVPLVLALAGIVAVVLFLTGGAGAWYRRTAEHESLPLGTTQPWG